MSVPTQRPLHDFGDRDIHILYAEDDDSLRESITALLLRYVDTIISASNGREGLDLYQQGKYDIVLTDVDMPVMNGIEMARHIKAINKDQVIIVTSAYNNSAHLQELRDAGIDRNYFVLKPIDTMELLKTFRMACAGATKRKKLETP